MSPWDLALGPRPWALWVLCCSPRPARWPADLESIKQPSYLHADSGGSLSFHPTPIAGQSLPFQGVVLRFHPQREICLTRWQTNVPASGQRARPAFWLVSQAGTQSHPEASPSPTSTSHEAGNPVGSTSSFPEFHLGPFCLDTATLAKPPPPSLPLTATLNTGARAGHPLLKTPRAPSLPRAHSQVFTAAGGWLLQKPARRKVSIPYS